jgi:hypothetical protein
MIGVGCHVMLRRLRVLSRIDLRALVILRLQGESSLHLVVRVVTLLASIEPPAGHLIRFDLNAVCSRSSCGRSCPLDLNAICTRGC